MKKKLLSWLLGTFLLFSGFLPGLAEAQEKYADFWRSLELPFIEEAVEIKINLPAARLDFYVNGEVYKSYGVAIGRYKHQTPVRNFRLHRIEWNPWWYPPKDAEWAAEAEDTPPGPSNPLGVVKMIMQKGILIHGTDKPWTIGRASSHGCLRMKNKEAQELAWEIQKRHSVYRDPKVLKKYKRQRKRTFAASLLESVPVTMEYKQVERFSDRLLLHPNRYWRHGFAKELRAALADQEGLVVNKKLIKKLNKMRRRRTVEVSLLDLQEWGKAACSEEALPVESKNTATAGLSL